MYTIYIKTFSQLKVDSMILMFVREKTAGMFLRICMDLVFITEVEDTMEGNNLCAICLCQHQYISQPSSSHCNFKRVFFCTLLKKRLEHNFYKKLHFRKVIVQSFRHFRPKKIFNLVLTNIPLSHCYSSEIHFYIGILTKCEGALTVEN